MRFLMSSRPPAHLDRRLQWRMLGGVALVAATMFAFSTFRIAQQRAERPATSAVAPDDLDFTVRTEPDSPLAPDEFRAVPERPARTATASTTDAPLDKSLLEDVRDNTLGIRHDEANAFYAVLDHVRRTPTEQLERSARNDVLYVNLMTESDKYRGEVVTVVGDMWRCYEMPRADSAGGPLYEAWVFTADSGTHPYRIVASELGAGLRVGERLRSPVRVTGCFFKREGYESQGGLHVAPTILAKSILSHRSLQGPPPADDLAPIMLGVVVAVGLILAATFLSFAWGDRCAARTQRAAAMRPFDLDEVKHGDQRSVNEALRELSERHRFGESCAAASANRAQGNGHAAASDVIDPPTPPPPTAWP